MATIKAVSSRAPIGTVIDYITQGEKTEGKLVTGINCNADTAKVEMEITKLLHHKTGGRTYKHFVQSFAPEEKVSSEKAHELAKAYAANCPQLKGFQVLVATHTDKGHIHTHFVVNSVSFEDGHKFQMAAKDLQLMKDLSDQFCREYGLTVCEKGKTFSGTERIETSAYSKETYQLLKKAEKEEAKSYVQDIAAAVIQSKAAATSKQDFVERLAKQGIAVDWQDSHKYITFTDLRRQQMGETQCKIRNNKLERYYAIDVSKEGLESEFKGNVRSALEGEAARDRAAKELAGAANEEDSRALASKLRAEERASAEERANKAALRQRQNSQQMQNARKMRERLTKPGSRRRSREEEDDRSL